jgi:protein involved in polysaccharide export with SLBB domain
MIREIILSLALALVSAAPAFSQTKPGEGFYLVVHYVTAECKAKIDGFYHVSADGRISLPAVNIELAAEKDIEVLRKKLYNAIQRYCHEQYPDRPGRGPDLKGNAYPDINFIPEEEAKKAGDGMLVVGAVKKPGVYPLPETPTVMGAVSAAGYGDTTSAWTVLRG